MAAREGAIMVRPGFTIPEGELAFSFVHSSGPGGQKVNKTATKVRLKWFPEMSDAVRRGLSPEERARLLERTAGMLAADGSIQVASERFRTQEANQAACRRKLAAVVRNLLVRPKKRRPTRPTAAARARRLREKERVSRIKKLRGKPREE